MRQQDWEDSLATPTTDGRVYREVESQQLPAYKNCLIKAKRKTGFGEWKYLSGGILHHVDPALRYLYIRIPGTNTTFPLPIPECHFWVLPQHASDEEIEQWEGFLEVVKLPGLHGSSQPQTVSLRHHRSACGGGKP